MGSRRAAAGRCHVNVLERRGILRVSRIDFHDDVVLIDRAIDDGYLPLPEGVVKCVVDLSGRYAEAGGRVTIIDEIRLQPFLLLV